MSRTITFSKCEPAADLLPYICTKWDMASGGERAILLFCDGLKISP